MTTPRPVFRTRLCDLLGIEYPILQSGMGSVAGPELAAEVSRAGGLGILAGRLKTADQLRAEIQSIRATTDRPFGVNLWLHRDMRPPTPASAVSATSVSAAQRMLNGFRRALGLPEQTGPPPQPPDLVGDALQVVLDERVPVFSTIFGPADRPMIHECRRRGIKVVAMVTSAEDARAVVADGADVVVAQGSEAGGHRGTFIKPGSSEAGAIGTMALIPEVVDAVPVPVVAAGGIADGRGLVAALALGASGVLMGTRFVVTRESMAPEMYRKAVLERGSDATTVTDAFTGLYARVLRNAFTEQFQQPGAPLLPLLWHELTASDIYRAAAAQGNPEYFPMWAGQSVGLIHNLPGAAEVVETTIREARALLLGELPKTVKID
jgi:nitronate monooxygenase